MKVTKDTVPPQPPETIYKIELTEEEATWLSDLLMVSVRWGYLNDQGHHRPAQFYTDLYTALPATPWTNRKLRKTIKGSPRGGGGF